MKLWSISFALAGLCMLAGAMGGLAVWAALKYVDTLPPEMSVQREEVS